MSDLAVELFRGLPSLTDEEDFGYRLYFGMPVPPSALSAVNCRRGLAAVEAHMARHHIDPYELRRWAGARMNREVPPDA